MERNFLKSVVVFVALAVLALMPVVEANYMVGYPYVGTAPKTHEARRWASSGFFDGRDLTEDIRDRSVNRYYIGGSSGRAWRPSLLLSQPGMAGEQSYESAMPLVTGTRCLGCEIGAYSFSGPSVRRGRYYFSNAEIAGRSRFVYTGAEPGMQSKLTTYGTNGRLMVQRNVGQRSRLYMNDRDLALLHEEAAAMLDNAEWRSGTRCLNCMYESGINYGRYYSTTPAVRQVGGSVDLY